MNWRSSSSESDNILIKVCYCEIPKQCKVKRVHTNTKNRGRLYYASTCNTPYCKGFVQFVDQYIEKLKTCTSRNDEDKSTMMHYENRASKKEIQMLKDSIRTINMRLQLILLFLILNVCVMIVLCISFLSKC